MAKNSGFKIVYSFKVFKAKDTEITDNLYIFSFPCPVQEPSGQFRHV